MPLKLRNRVIERRSVLGADLAPNPRNWRTHPTAQAAALKGVLSEIGQVGELYAYHSARNGGKLTLIDGHLRSEAFADQLWDVAITDLDDAEADKLLLSYDPLTALAEANKEKLEALLRDVQTGDAGLAAMLDDLAKQNGLVPGEKSDDKPKPNQPVQDKFEILVECSGEDQQRELYERLTAEGLSCRVLTL